MLEMKNVVKTFGHVTALDNLSLTVPNGAVYGLGAYSRRSCHVRKVFPHVIKEPLNFPLGVSTSSSIWLQLAHGILHLSLKYRHC